MTRQQTDMLLTWGIVVQQARLNITVTDVWSQETLNVL